MATRWDAGLMGGLAAVVTTLAAVAGIYAAYEARPETIENRAAEALLNSKTDEVMELAQAIMPRPRLAGDLTKHLLENPRAYVVVVGPRGCGKTTGVLHALSGKAGVLRVKMTEHEDACVAIAKALRMPDGVANAMTQTMLESVLRKTVEKGGDPTIIAELNRGARSEEFVLQVGVLKELCADKGLVKVVIVLGDADAAFAMPEDFARQYVIWVNDFNEDDAHIYLDKLGAPQPRNELFYEAGTRPMDLWAATQGGFLRFIALARGQADKKVRTLAHLKCDIPEASGPAFKRLIVDLLENTSDGWSLQGFDKSAENLGLPSSSTDEYLEAPEVVADVYKDRCHAVLYHEPSDSWRFHSTSHRRAAERLYPEAAARGAAKSRPRSTWWSPIFG